MDPAIMKIKLKVLLQKLFRLSAREWMSIVSIGTEGVPTYWDRKRIRLLNGICFCIVIAYIGYTLAYPLPTHKILFWESVQGIFCYAIPIVFNYFRKPDVACHFFCIYNLLLYTFFAIFDGKGEMAIFFLMVSSVTPMLFFRKSWVIVVYFLLNLLFFLICNYLFTVIKPVFIIPGGFQDGPSNVILVFIFLSLIVYYFKSENSKQEELLEIRNRRLEEEKQKSDDLLLNILPEEIAQELKDNGTVQSRSFNKVTVMFTGFKDFSLLCEKLPPDELVSQMNRYFSDFDEIISKYGIEKIKTIGDGYMCAGGLPEENNNNFNAVIEAALEIREYMLKIQKERELLGKPVFEIRIGIHTGPVIAGIVGTKKFAYDVWGDTVNTASRMETGSEPGKINISKDTFELIKNKFHCTYRGKIEAKNKGIVDMYFVEEEN